MAIGTPSEFSSVMDKLHINFDNIYFIENLIKRKLLQQPESLLKNG